MEARKWYERHVYVIVEPYLSAVQNKGAKVYPEAE